MPVSTKASNDSCYVLDERDAELLNWLHEHQVSLRRVIEGGHRTEELNKAAKKGFHEASGESSTLKK